MVAIVVPNKASLMNWASNNPAMSGLSFENLCKQPAVKAELMALFRRYEGSVQKYEIPKNICTPFF